MPTETTERRIELGWDAPAALPEGLTLTAYRLRREGDQPTILPPLAPDAVTVTDVVEPGTHRWTLIAEYSRAADDAIILSDPAPLGDPPPCVVVLATAPAPPVLTGVSPASTLTGVAGMHVRWTLEGADRPVRVERRPDGVQTWGHVGSAPGGFYFDLFALDAGVTYCYRACLLNAEAPTCSAAQCAVFTGP